MAEVQRVSAEWAQRLRWDEKREGEEGRRSTNSTTPHHQKTAWYEHCGESKPVLTQMPLHLHVSTHSIDYPVEINACSQPPGTRRRCFDNELYLLHTKCLDGGKAHDRVAKSSRDPDRVQAASGKRCRILQDNASTPMGRLPW